MEDKQLAVTAVCVLTLAAGGSTRQLFGGKVGRVSK